MTPAHPLRGRDRRRRWAGALGPALELPIDPDLDPTDPAEPGPHHRRVSIPVRRGHPGVLAAVAAGGFLGALARYELQRTWPVPAGAFPSSTFVINISGAFVLGLLLASLARARARWSISVRLFAGVGVLGAWTTVSTVAVEAATLVRGGSAALALGYLVASMAAGVTAAAFGTTVARLPRPRPPSETPGAVGP